MIELEMQNGMEYSEMNTFCETNCSRKNKIKIIIGCKNNRKNM